MTYNFLTTVIITEIFDPTTELVITAIIPTKEAKAEIETHPVTVESRIRKCAIKLKSYKSFCASY